MSGRNVFWSLNLFSLYGKMISRLLGNEEGISVGGMIIRNIRLAGDMVFMDKSKAKLPKILDKSVVENEERGITLNCKKTITVVFSKK